MYIRVPGNGNGNDGELALHEKYAAKFNSCKGAAARLRVREEIDILASLNHQNILRYGFVVLDKQIQL